MAGGWARAIGGARGVVAWTAGLHPAGRLAVEAVAAMQEAGVDIAGEPCRGLDQLPQGITFDATVLLGGIEDTLPVKARHMELWPVAAPLPEAVASARDEIRRRVQRLIDELLSR